MATNPRLLIRTLQLESSIDIAREKKVKTGFQHGCFECDITPIFARQQKCHRGIIGFSTSEGTVQRWVLTSHIIAKLIANMESEFNLKNTPTKNPRISVVRARRELETLDAPTKFYVNWGNSFDNSRSSLINICSGIEASSEIKSDLLTAEAVGESCFESFCIQSSNVPFYDPILKS